MPKSIYEEVFFALHLILRGKLEVDGREVLLRSENMLNLFYNTVQFSFSH